MKKNFKKYLFIFLIALAVSVVLSPLRARDYFWGYGGEQLAFPAFIIAYIAITIWFLTKYKDTLPITGIVLTTLFGAIILDLPIRIFAFESSVGTTPDFIFRILAVLTGLAIFKAKSITLKIALAAPIVLLCVWYIIWGVGYWDGFILRVVS